MPLPVVCFCLNHKKVKLRKLGQQFCHVTAFIRESNNKYWISPTNLLFLFIHSVVQSINIWFVRHLAFSNLRCLITPCKGIRILESGKLFFACGIWNPGPWNLEHSSRNLDPTNNWNPESKFPRHRIWNWVRGIWNPRHGIQNRKMSQIPKHWARLR